MAAGDLITRDGQIEWRGVLLGAGTPYRKVGLEGWQDLADVRSDNPNISGYHGAYQGSLLSAPRVVTFSYLLATSTATFPGHVRELQRITALREDTTEEPLVIQLDGRKHYAMARCHRRSIPVDKRYPLGYTTGAIEWVATNPRKYQLPQQSVSCSLAAPPVGGLVWPLVFPLDFNQTISGGVMTLTNNGNADAWPTFTVLGPMTGPTITNLTTGQKLVFNPVVTVIPGGIEMVIDTRPSVRTVRGAGTSVRQLLISADWFAVPAGSSIQVGITSSTYDPAALLTAAWYHTDL